MSTADEHLSASLLASLPMYDLSEIRDATDAFWRAIAMRLQRRGLAAPATLTRGEGAGKAAWTSERLLLSQTCGYPLVTELGDSVSVIGAPSYDAAGCETSYHRSAVVVRTRSRAASLSDLRNLRCAVNERSSNTGMNLMRAKIAGLADGRSFFSQIVLTGSHAASLESLAEGRADVAAIDPVTLTLLQRHRPVLTSAVRILDWTVRSHTLPLITSLRGGKRTLGMLRSVLADVSAEPALREVRRELLWADITPFSLADYEPLRDYARLSAELGYPELR